MLLILEYDRSRRAAGEIAIDSTTGCVGRTTACCTIRTATDLRLWATATCVFMCSFTTGYTTMSRPCLRRHGEILLMVTCLRLCCVMVNGYGMLLLRMVGVTATELNRVEEKNTFRYKEMLALEESHKRTRQGAYTPRHQKRRKK